MPATTIQVDVEVRDRLRALGRMGESYNDVIKRLLLAARHLEPVRPPGPISRTDRPPPRLSELG